MDNIQDALRRAELLLAGKDYQKSHAICLEVLRVDSTQAGAWFLLGVLAADHSNYGRAVDLLEKAANLDTSDPRPLVQLARCGIAMNRQAEAVELAERAVALAPQDALSLDTLGVVFSRAGLHARAVEVFEQAVAREPRNASFLYNLAASRQFSGQFEAADEAYGRALAEDPGLYRAWSSRVQLRRQAPQANFIAELAPLMAAGGGDPDRDLHLGHALAKSYEDLGDYEQALAWLLRAKAPKRTALDYSPETDAALFAAAHRALAQPAAGACADAPIFVVGLPRTGTTLVDRILSSHPDVVSAGELTNFGLILKRAAGTPSKLVLDPATLEAGAGLDLAAIGRAYVDSVAALRGGAPRFVDKMPLNVFYAGLIHAAMPNARIVCLRRDPMDACLSNFRQLFATGFSYYNYAYDLEDVGRYYLGFDRLVGCWRENLPKDRFMEVAYEHLVADQEGQTRRLLDFCGLSWDARCLAFHENAAPVATASSVQVRQPLYSSSVGRWRRYGAGLEPLRAVLAAGGVI